MKIFLALISCLLVSSCSVYKPLKPAPASQCSLPANYRITGGQYNTQIELYGKHFSGIMIFKELNPGNMRAVFTNEMGLKFFDFGFTADSLKVHYILPGMNKKLIVETFKKDLGMLCAPRAQNFDVLQNTKTNEFALRTKDGKGLLYYFTNQPCDTITRIERGNKTKPSVITYLAEMEKSGPQKVKIRHKNFKLLIMLTRLQQ